MLTLDPADKRFWPKTTEPGFSVKKNNFIIEDAIKKHDLNVRKKNAEFEDKLGERSEAATMYLTGMHGASKSRSVEQYFGKVEHAHLKGQDIRSKLIEQQKMMITSKKEAYEQEQARKLISKSVGDKIRRTNAKKKQKSSKKV